MKTKKKVYRAAIVGLGRIASTFDKDPKRKHVATHAGAYKRIPGVELCAVCDQDETKLAEFSKAWGVKALYKNFDAMLKTERPHIVSICTWPGSHYDLAVRAVKGGVKAIFCEKPITEKLDDADRLVKLCEDHKVVLAVNHSRRWDEGHERVKALLAAGKIGQLRQVQCYYTAGIANTGTHLFDLLHYYLGEPVWAKACERPVFGDKDPTLSGQMLFEKDVLVSIIGLDVKDYLIFEIEFYGSKGRLRIKHSGFDLALAKVDESSYFSGYKELKEIPAPFSMKHKTMMLNAVKNILVSLKTKKLPKSSGRDGQKSLEMICAFKQSWKTGKQMNLPLKIRKVKI